MRTIAIAAGLLAATLLSACNTVEGAGRDIQGAGEAVEDGAKKVKKAITN